MFKSRRFFRWITLLILLGAAIISFTLLHQPPVVSCLGMVDPEYRWIIGPARWLIRETRSAFAAPGLTVAVAVDQELVWSEGFGYADLANHTPACPDTRFRVGSVSKPMTAAAIAVLYDQGRLNLDVPVQTYVPEFPAQEVDITIRQLLGHTAGVRHNDSFQDILNTRHYATVLDTLDIFKEDPLLFIPGTHYSYSSYGYNLLGAVIEGVSGEEYLVFMRNQIWQPLGMNHTQADGTESSNGDLATFYEDLPSGLQVAPFADLSHKLPSGGLVSTAEDLVRFASALNNGLLVGDQTKKLLFSPICPDCPAQGEREGEGYGFGWELDQDPFGRRIALHTGATVGASAGLSLYPDQDLALALLMNVGSVTSPNPELHGFPPDPQWIAQLFFLAGGLTTWKFALLSSLLLLIALLAVIGLRQHDLKGRARQLE